ncbi:MAG: thioredoxin [Acidobacteria bacterium]|nr:thioredoxin [Acidobacteriota bacterium]
MAEERFIKDVGASDFQQAVVEESRRRPVVVDFWAEWCGPCRMIGPILEKLAEEFQGDFLLAKVDTDLHPALAQQFSVRSIPNVKVFRDGRIVDELVGALPESEVRSFLRRHCPSAADRKYAEATSLAARGGDAQPLLEEVLRLDAEHPAGLTELGKILASQGDIKGAAALWDRVPYLSAQGDEAEKLKQLLQFHRVCREQGGGDACAARSTADPADLEARYAHACCLAATGEYRAALENFFTIVERDKSFRDGAARKAMLAIFAISGERSSLAEEYRKRLAMALF